MRAMGLSLLGNGRDALALDLLVADVGADDAHPAVAADDAALLADAPDGRSDLHDGTPDGRLRALLGSLSVDDTTLRQVVGTHFDGDAVPGQDADEVHAHLAGHVREDPVPVLELDHEHRVRAGLDHLGLETEGVFLRHRATPS